MWFQYNIKVDVSLE